MVVVEDPREFEYRRKESEHLKEALELNAPLATAYYMKEELCQFWEQEDKVPPER